MTVETKETSITTKGRWVTLRDQELKELQHQLLDNRIQRYPSPSILYYKGDENKLIAESHQELLRNSVAAVTGVEGSQAGVYSFSVPGEGTMVFFTYAKPIPPEKVSEISGIQKEYAKYINDRMLKPLGLDPASLLPEK